jgi:probable rRNA maturation factor
MTQAATPRLSLQITTNDHDDQLPHASTLRRWVRLTLETPLPGRRGRQAAHPVEAQIGLAFVNAQRGRALNKQFRQRDYATNVLTFAYESRPVLMADVILCLPVVQKEARHQGKTLRAHLAHLVIHGVLHAMGHDHEKDAEARRMQTLEIDLLARLRIADPYPAMIEAESKMS